MPTYFVTGTETATRVLLSSDDLVVTRNGLITTTSTPGVQTAGSNNLVTVTVDGGIYGGTYGLFFANTGALGGASIQVTQNGVIAGLNDRAIYVEGAFTRIENQGAIFSSFNQARPVIELVGASNVIQNSGSIAGWQGIVFNQGSTSGFSSIRNSGEIRSQEIAVRAFGQSLEIVNSGSIGSARGDAISVSTPSETLTLVNHAAGIISAGGLGFSIRTSTGSDLIVNRGLIQGTMMTGDGGDFVDNRGGTISGSVDLGLGNDRIDNRGGTITGTIFGGLGNDVYLVSDTETVLIEEAGGGIDTVISTVDYSLGAGIEILTLLAGATNGSGNNLRNILTGNAAANTLDGGANHDFLYGRGGDDTLWGGAGNDTLRGDEGNDILQGEGGADVLNGGTGNDLLYGGAGNDVLRGGEGEDLLQGGAGRDTLFGDADADIFLFTRRIDSPDTADADLIMDFEQGLDLIDLTAFGATWRGTAGFTGTGAEVRHNVQGTNSLVRVDVNGDGVADMRIVVRNVTALTEADFLL